MKSSVTEPVLRRFIRIAIGIFLIAPYLIWLYWIPSWTWPSVQHWLPLFATTLIQSTISASLSLIAGFFLFLGLQGWGGSRIRVIGEWSLLLPNLVPALFLMLSLFAWVTPFMAFPYGLPAVIFSHVLLNAGLVAIGLDRVVHSKLSRMAETAWTMGARPFQFWREVGWPILKGDLACLYLFVFSICFTSFSIPLLVGGPREATFEVAIYDAIRIDGRWDKALFLAAFQSLMLFLFAWILPQPFWPSRPAREGLRYLGSRIWKYLVFVPAVFVLGGWLAGGFHATHIHLAPEIVRAFWGALLTSFVLGVTVGVIHLLLLLATAFGLPHQGLSRFLNGYLAPSPVIAGFALVLLPGDGPTLNLLKLALALSLISYPLLYRWMGHSALAPLEKQVAVARSLGAGWFVILAEVVWPQTASAFMRVCAMAAVWACGDFAISGIVLGHSSTLPLLIEDLLNNYQFAAAQLLMFPLLILSVAVYVMFTGVSRYVRG